jgi:2-aminoethylphosphonate-pyruvate transaminase
MLAAKQQVLFNPGPVNLDPAVKSNLFNVELCHRQPEFDELRARLATGLFAAAGLDPGDHNLSLLHGSGTLAVDAALASLVRGRVLVVDNGVYCRRLVTTLRSRGGSAVSEHTAGIGRRPDLEALEDQVRAEQPEWLAIVHHETMTGLLNPLAEIAEIAERHRCRLFVDAVSSLPVHPIDARADVVCFNSNKCLESLPGIAGVFWRRDLSPQPTVPVLDVSAYVDEIPSTPNVQAYVALDIALELLAAEDRAERYRRLAERVWEAGGARFEPLLAEADRSHVLTSFRLGGRDPDELLRAALRHGYVIYEGQGPLREEIFRVANMGAMIDEPLIDDLFDVLSNVS